MTNKLANWLILTVGIAGALLCAELSCRLYYLTKYLRQEKVHARYDAAARRSTVPGVPFMLATDGAGEINSFGIFTFRSPAVEQRKRNDTCRIVVIGDSMAYGVGVESDRTFSRLLESRLNRTPVTGRYSRFEVVNMGVPLYDIFAEAKLIEAVVNSKLAPDIVLLAYFGSNDRILSSWEYRKDTGRYTAFFHRLHSLRIPDIFPFLPAALKSQLIRNSYLYEAVCIGSFRITKMVNPSARIGLETVEETLAEEALRDILRSTRGRGIGFIALNLPWARYDREATWDLEGEEWMEHMARKYSFPSVDIRPVFRQVAPERLAYSPRDDAHPGPLGHQLIADALYGFLSGTPGLSVAAAQDKGERERKR